jgi:hypothetical protein
MAKKNTFLFNVYLNTKRCRKQKKGPLSIFASTDPFRQLSNKKSVFDAEICASCRFLGTNLKHGTTFDFKC